jgi:hypothetical protein
MPPVEDDPRYISWGALLWPAMGEQIEVSFVEGEPVQPATIYNLVQRGLIATDESITEINIVTGQNGERRVSISLVDP